MSKPLVYLAGAMTHVPNRDEDWRDEAATLLAPEFDVLDPCKLEAKHLTCEQIVSLDYGCVLRASLALVRAHVPSWGTAMELAFAKQHGTPVVAWDCPAGKLSPWLIAHTRLRHVGEQSLTSAIRQIKAVYR